MYVCHPLYNKGCVIDTSIYTTYLLSLYMKLAHCATACDHNTDKQLNTVMLCSVQNTLQLVPPNLIRMPCFIRLKMLISQRFMYGLNVKPTKKLGSARYK